VEETPLVKVNSLAEVGRSQRKVLTIRRATKEKQPGDGMEKTLVYRLMKGPGNQHFPHFCRKPNTEEARVEMRGQTGGPTTVTMATPHALHALLCYTWPPWILPTTQGHCGQHHLHFTDWEPTHRDTWEGTQGHTAWMGEEEIYTMQTGLESGL
jgi:hypothetical protein